LLPASIGYENTVEMSLDEKYVQVTRKNISVKSLIIKSGMSSTPTDFDGLRRLIILKTSESETGAKDKNSEDEKEGKTTRQVLLCTD
jgi:hypothetical protein